MKTYLIDIKFFHKPFNQSGRKPLAKIRVVEPKF